MISFRLFTKGCRAGLACPTGESAEYRNIAAGADGVEG